jgi:hypothetical protein
VRGEFLHMRFDINTFHHKLLVRKSHHANDVELFDYSPLGDQADMFLQLERNGFYQMIHCNAFRAQ